MATTKYTNSDSEIVFLNDKCIAQTSGDIEKIDFNAIPSLSLFNNEMSTRVENDRCIRLSVDGISSTVELSVKNAVLSAEQWAISVERDSKEYSDGEIKTTKDELSNTLSSYTNTKITSLSATTNAEFAKYDDFSFEYDSDRHLIQLTLKNKDGRTVTKSIESTDFIKNRIIDHIDITDDGKYLRIFWKNSTGADDHVDIELADLVQIYTGKDGIVISQSDTGPYTIAANETIARTSDLTGIAATVNELSTKTINRLDGRIDKLSSDISVIQTYTDELSARDGIIQTIENHLNVLDTKTDTTNTDLETEKSKIVVLQAYADELSNNSDTAPGTIKQLKIADNQLSTVDGYLSTEIDRLRNDVSGTVAIVGHIKLDKKTGIGPDEKDNKLSTIFQHYHFAEIGTLRNGNAYSVEITGLEDTYKDLSTSYFETADKPAIRLADGDYVVLHSHTADPITLDNLTDNIVIVPSVKPYQLYSLSCNVYNLSVNLSTDLSVEKVRAISVVTELSDAISSKIYIDDVSTESLCAIHCSMDDYYRRVIDGSVLSNELYILSGEYVNIYNQKIKFVDAPVDSTDAATKGYVDDAISKLSTDLSTDISALSDGISADVKQLSTDVSTISAGLTADVKYLSTEVSAVSTLLSNDISCKIGADGRYLSTLSILHIDDDDYYDLVKNYHVNPDTLYIVSGDYNNAYDLQVKYVAEPTDDSDATNKKYVDDKCAAIDSEITTIGTTVTTTLSTLKSNLSAFADSTKAPKIADVVNALSSIYSMISAFPS